MDRIIYKFQAAIVLVVLLLIHFSFASLSSLPALVCEFLVVFSFLFYGLKQFFRKSPTAFDYFSSPFSKFLSFVMLWLIVQIWGTWLSLPGWPIAGNWNQWFLFYLQFFTACALAFLTETLLTSRSILERFLTLFFLLQGALAIGFLCLLLISQAKVESLAIPWAHLPYLNKWSSHIIQPNNLVDLWMPGIFLGMGISIYRIEKKIREGFFSFDLVFTRDIFLTFLMLLALLMTESRGGIVAFGAGAVLFTILMLFGKGNRAIRTILLLGLIGAAVAGLFVVGIEKSEKALSTLSHISEDASINYRKSVIHDSMELISRRGLIGVGLGQFHFGWIWYCEKPGGEFPVRSYNDLLWFWAEGGFPAILFLTAAFCVAFKWSTRLILRTESRWIGNLSASALASSGAFIAHSMMDPTFYVPALLWLFFMGLGLAGALYRMEIEETQDENAQPLFSQKKFLNGIWIFLAIVCLIGSGFKLLALGAKNFMEQPKGVKIAMLLDPMNSEHAANLAAYEEKKYFTDKDFAHLQNAEKYLRQAIDLDSLFLSRAARLADVLKKTRGLEGVDEAFSELTHKLDGYYWADMTASIYWMSMALSFSKEKNSHQEDYAKRKAFLYYESALRAFPEMKLPIILWYLGDGPLNEYYLKSVNYQPE